MGHPPVVVVESGGVPRTQVAEGSSAPSSTVVESGARAITLADNAPPIALFYPDGSYYTGFFPMPNWDAAKALVLADGGNAKILVIGDSTVPGSGAGGPDYVANARQYNFLVKLAAKFVAAGVPARADAVIGRGNRAEYATFDPRFTISSANWTNNSGASTPIGRTWSSNVDGEVWSYTFTGDRVELGYVRGPTQGSFNYKIDAGSDTLVSANGAAALIRLVIDPGSLGAHTLTVTKSGTSRINLASVRPWDTTTSQVEIIQAGGSGWLAANFVVNTNPYDALGQISSEAADLVVIDLTINDWNAATDPATYQAQLGLIIDTAKAAGGDVLVCTGVPSDPTVNSSLAVQLQYVEYARAVARAKECNFVNVHFRWGGNFTTKNALGWYADDKHPYGIGETGYDDYAQAVFEPLVNP